MSENYFHAIDEASSQGLEEALKALDIAAIGEHNYSLSRKVKFLLKTMELGLFESPEKEETEQIEQEAPEDQNTPEKQLEEFSKQLHSETGDLYKANGKLGEAAEELRWSGRKKEAIELYIQEGSEDSLRSAASLALGEKDYRLGLDLTLKTSSISRAFDEASDLISHKISREQVQEWKEYVLRLAYSSIIDSVKSKAEAQTGRKPEGETLPQLLETVQDKEVLGGIYYDLDAGFIHIMLTAKSSSNPEILQLGIDFINFKRGSAPCRGYEDCNRSDLLYLKAKLTGKDEDIQIILNEAESTLKEEGNRDWNHEAENAIEILSHYNRKAEALEVAEKFLSATHRTRFILIRESGDMQRLAGAYRETGDPINYVMAVFGKSEQFYL